MQKTKIKWPWFPLYTWNPVTGCIRNCPYCYAKKLSDRFKMQEDFTKLKVWPDRMADPLSKMRPCNIFVGSMSDICYWNRTWIETVICTCIKSPLHTFLFLTKDPAVYFRHTFPENCILGISLNGNNWGAEMERIKIFQELKHRNKFISVEPLLGGDFQGFDFNGIGEIIVGAMTGPGAVKPKREWIESIKAAVKGPIFWKESMKGHDGVGN